MSPVTKIRYANIYCNIWRDKKFRNQLNDKEQKLFLLMLSSGSSNMIGYYEYPIDYALSDAGRWNINEFKNAMNKLESLDMIYYDYDNEIVFIKNYLKYNKIVNINQLKGAINQFNQVEDSPLKSKFLDSWNNFVNSYFNENNMKNKSKILKILNDFQNIQDDKIIKDFNDDNDKVSSYYNNNIDEEEPNDFTIEDLIKQNELLGEKIKERYSSKNFEVDLKPLASPQQLQNQKQDQYQNQNQNQYQLQEQSQTQKQFVPTSSPSPQKTFYIFYDLCPNHIKNPWQEDAFIAELENDFPEIELNDEFKNIRNWISQKPLNKRPKNLYSFIRKWLHDGLHKYHNVALCQKNVVYETVFQNKNNPNDIIRIKKHARNN